MGVEVVKATDCAYRSEPPLLDQRKRGYCRAPIPGLQVTGALVPASVPGTEPLVRVRALGDAMIVGPR